MLNTFLTALLQLGLPVAAISWLLLSPLFRQGLLDQQGNEKELNAELKALRKRGARAQHATTWRGFVARLAEQKWFQFGGGFYGCAALWTLAVTEFQDLLWLLGHPDGWGGLLDQGMVALIIAFLMNQLQNLITAVTWFLFWGHGATIPIWIAAAYFGFRSGALIGRTQWGVLRDF
ncbi:MAG: hypothetical protein AAF513_02625 [Pseudomonadota bacterium]